MSPERTRTRGDAVTMLLDAMRLEIGAGKST
jgi:hypothetical protein